MNKLILSVCGLLITVITTAYANLGDTLNDSIRRWGNSYTKNGEAFIWHEPNSPYFLFVTFKDKGNRCDWMMLIQDTPYTEQELNDLLAYNVPEIYSFRQSQNSNDQVRVWDATNGSRFIYYIEPGTPKNAYIIQFHSANSVNRIALRSP